MLRLLLREVAAGTTADVDAAAVAADVAGRETGDEDELDPAERFRLWPGFARFLSLPSSLGLLVS